MNEEQPKVEDIFAATINEPTDDISTSKDRPETYEERAIRITEESMRQMNFNSLKKFRKDLGKSDSESPKDPTE